MPRLFDHAGVVVVHGDPNSLTVDAWRYASGLSSVETDGHRYCQSCLSLSLLVSARAFGQSNPGRPLCSLEHRFDQP